MHVEVAIDRNDFANPLWILNYSAANFHYPNAWGIKQLPACHSTIHYLARNSQKP